MTEHFLTCDRKNLHGTFDASLSPVLRVEPGDRVRFSTLDGDWHIAPQQTPRTGSGTYFTPKKLPDDAGHALIGPIYVNGAHPGDTLEVRILSLTPGAWGWSRTGGPANVHTRRLNIPEGEEHYLLWSLDNERMRATSNEGHTVAMDPFLGVLGTAPNREGMISTHPPGSHGGNLDCRALTPGSTLYLPVFHEGALFSAGDGHARQGDGEAGGTAIECPMQDVLLELNVCKGLLRDMPYAKTADAYIAFGFDEDLTRAAYQALEGIVSILQALYGFARTEALSMSSLVCDLRITQIVNGIRGVHAILPLNAIASIENP